MCVMHIQKAPPNGAAITEGRAYIGCEIGDCDEEHSFHDHEDRILAAREGWWEHHGVHFCPTHAPEPFTLCPN